jgi:hypothetical protein
MLGAGHARLRCFDTVNLRDDSYPPIEADGGPVTRVGRTGQGLRDDSQNSGIFSTQPLAASDGRPPPLLTDAGRPRPDRCERPSCQYAAI